MNHHFWRKFDGYLLCLGPDAVEMYDDYVWCFPVDSDGKIQGVSTRPITKEAHDDAIRAVNEKFGKLASYERMGDDGPIPVVQISGINERKITMAKVKGFKKAELAKSHTGKGQYDRAAVSADMLRVKDANDAEQCTLITRRMSIGEASDGSGKKSQHVFLEWRLDDPSLAQPE